jgi:hypothetical protein
MTRKIVLLPLAQKEIRSAIEHYQQISPELGARFQDYLDGYISLLQSGTVDFALKKGVFREIPLKRFPFLVIYEVLDLQTVLIHSLFNTHQNPDKKP